MRCRLVARVREGRGESVVPGSPQSNLNQACQSVFRSMHMLEKSVERCALTLGPTEGTATFKLHCKHGG